MATTLNYGLDTTCLLDAVEVVLLRAQQQQPLPGDKIAAAVSAQLEQPTDYPSVSQATIPGDHIVLAIAAGIPQQLAVIDGALTALRDAGAEQACITVLVASPLVACPLAAREKLAEQLKSDLAAMGHAQCHVTLHDPDDTKACAFLGVTQAGRALRLNRQLCDADFVLPIGVTSGEPRQSASPSCFGGLFPAFSDREAIERFSGAAAGIDATARTEARREREECAHLLGVGMALQVIPSAGGQVAAILAGEPTSVARQAAATYRQTWECDTSLRGALVVATLTGDASEQTWHHFGRALAAAATVLETDGAIAICSELAEPPGRGLSQLIGNEDPLVIEREILRNPSIDSGPALQLCRALQRGAVYLRSQLRPAVVESLGISPLESDTELERLAQALRPCLVLEEAQRLLPRVVADNADATGSVEIGSVEIGSVEIGSVATGSVEIGSVEIGSVETGSVEIGSVEIGSVETGSAENGSVRSGSINSGADPT